MIILLLLSDEQTVYGSMYNNEHVAEAIGIPAHCLPLIQLSQTRETTTHTSIKTDQFNPSLLPSITPLSTTVKSLTSTTSSPSIHSLTQTLQAQCPSACNKDLVSNNTPEVPDAPELLVPESIDVIEPNTTSKPVTPTTEHNENNQYKANLTDENYIGDELTTKSTIRNGNMNKLLHADRPIEIKDLSTSSSQLSTVASAAYSHGLSSNDFYRSSDLSEPIFISSSVISKKEGVDASDIQSVLLDESLVNNKDDNVSTYNNKKSNKSLDKTAIDSNEDGGKSESAEVSPQSAHVTSNNNGVVSVAAAESVNPCISIRLLLRIDAFNVSVGSNQICPQSNGHGFNITANIPVSKYMKEKRFELIFV